MDSRIALKKQSVLHLPDLKDYTILQEIGRGASCIVYDAQYISSTGQPRPVRIKECYPYAIPVTRQDSGQLYVAEQDATEFEEAESLFRNAFQVNGYLMNETGLTNSVAHMYDLYEANNTLYIVMDYQSGNSYDKLTDSSPKQATQRIRSVATVLQKYHDAGYLYLDMKPENILLLPETDELVALFDFDSTVKKQDLREGKCCRISYSPNYCAPELMQYRLERINEKTDIYSVGVMLFVRLFGRTPTIEECRHNAKFDMDQLKEKYATYPPRFFTQLANFFHHTMVSTQSMRCDSMQQVVDLLTNLMEVCVPDAVYVRDNFTYHNSCFVGREEELETIHEYFQESHVVFLHGVGGIGKTELANRYIHTHRADLQTVVAVRFSGSIRQTLLNEVKLEHFKREENEKDDAYFKRFLEQMKCCLTPDDLFLLDNFDVEKDDDLETLLQCQCKFLITTREDYRDYDYRQMDVGAMKDRSTLQSLFGYYNDTEYTEDQWDTLYRLFGFVDFHTMMIALLAKYLRITQESPYELYRKMRKAEGLTELDDTNIKQRKDRQLRPQSVERHLLTLFDLSGFTEPEKTLLRSLSLLGELAIDQDAFLDWIGMTDEEACAEALVRHGWIQKYDNKIMLHQIILDLVYNHLAPNAEHCNQLVESMAGYAETIDGCNYTESSVRRRVMQMFNARISGETPALVRYYMQYTEHVSRQREIVERCLSLCLKDPEQYIEEISKLYLYQAMESSSNIDIIEYFDEPEKQAQLLKKIFDNLQLSADYAKKLSSTPNDIARFKLNLAEYAQDTISEMESSHVIDDDILEQGYDFVGQKYDEAVTYMVENHVDSTLLKQAYEKFSLFFGEDDFTQMYRWNNHRDLSKKLHYAKLYYALDKSSDEDVFICDNPELEYTEIAKQAIENGNYKTAAECFDLMLKEDDELYNALPIADCYRKIGRFQDALEVLEQDIRDYLPEDDEKYRMMIDICVEHGKLKQAQLYCSAFIQRVIQKSQCGKDRMAYTALLASLYWHYAELMMNKAEKTHYQQMAEDLCSQDHLLAKQNGMAYFLLKSAVQSGKKTNWARLLQSVKLFSQQNDADMLSCALCQVVDQAAPLPRVEQRVSFMLRSLDSLACYIQTQNVTDILEFIWGYLKNNTLQEPYLRAKAQAYIVQADGGEIGDGFTWEMQYQFSLQCDYRLLGQKDERRGTRTDAIERWLHYAELCPKDERPETALYCYERALKLWAPLIDTIYDRSTGAFIRNIFCKVGINEKQKNFVEASQELERIERLVQSYRASGINSNWRIDPEYIAKSLAEQWEECRQPDRACRAWMLRALLLVEDEDVRCTILPELMTYDKGQLQERFIQLLQKTWDADTLDEIVSVCEKIFSLTVDTEPNLHSVCGTFLKHKRNDIIDFKEDL